MFELLLLGEGGTIDLPGVLHLLLHVDFSVGILHMQNG